MEQDFYFFSCQERKMVTVACFFCSEIKEQIKEVIVKATALLPHLAL